MLKKRDKREFLQKDSYKDIFIMPLIQCAPVSYAEQGLLILRLWLQI